MKRYTFLGMKRYTFLGSGKQTLKLSCAYQVVLVVRNPPTNAGDIRQKHAGSLGWEDPPEEGMATHSSSLAWRILWTEEIGGYSTQVHKGSNTTEMTQHTSMRKYYTLTRILILEKKSTILNSRCGETGTLIHCSRKQKTVQSLWKTTWQFYKN